MTDIEHNEVRRRTRRYSVLLWIAALLCLCGCSARRPDTTRADQAGKVEAEASAFDQAGVDMTEVNSTVFAEEGYDEDHRVLLLRFRSNGALYAYYDVEEAVYRDFLRAESKGTFFGDNIRDVYRYEKLESGDDYEGAPLYDKTSYDRATFAVNYSSGRFHTMDCEYANAKNVAYVSNIRSELEDMGYHPCKLCLPD